MELSDFLHKNRIDNQTWQAADIEWGVLTSIYNDHVKRRPYLEAAADFFVKSIQAFDGVHSVRWRVKDPEHLLEKVIRKRAELPRPQRYADVSVDNYHEVVTDLVGVRALHLFKDECLTIHDAITGMWETHEPPVLYIREGDRSNIGDAIAERSIQSKVHPAGYRSIHYVLKSNPANREVLVEVQVRTIFEEAWSEIDHRVRYPNFSKNSQVENILKIFNRLSGSADEMGGFIRDLSSELDEIEKGRDSLTQQRDSALEEMQRLLSELSDTRETKAMMVEKVERLQRELDKVRRSVSGSAHGMNNFARALVGSASRKSTPTGLQSFLSTGIPRLGSSSREDD